MMGHDLSAPMRLDTGALVMTEAARANPAREASIKPSPRIS